MPARITFATDLVRRPVALGLGAVALTILLAGGLLLWALPAPGAFDARVERLFVENADLTSEAEVKLLEILARSGGAFADVLGSYRVAMVVLLLAVAALLVTSLALLTVLVGQARRIAQLEGGGLRIDRIALDRETRTVTVNDVEVQLTEAALETLAVLAEARLDGDVLSGAEIEATITGKSAHDCDEGAGVTRIKRLRDALGNQVMAAILVRTIARRGYALSVPPEAIRLG